MSHLQTQLETPICYLIKLQGDYAEFIWTATPWNPLKGSDDLKTRVKAVELFYLTSILDCSKKDDLILPSNLETYNRLLIYASVRPTVRSGEKARDLMLLTLDLNSLDSHYWASRFRELWWRYGQYRPLVKTCKSFKLFFGLD